MGTETRLLRRSRSDRTLAGVCGGLAAYFEIHPAIFRVAFVVLTLLGGAGVLIYLAAILVMPDDGQEDSIATAVLRRRRDRPLLLIVLGLVDARDRLAALGTATLPRGDVWLVLLVAGGVILWIALGVVREGALAALRRIGVAAGSIVAVLLVVAAIFVAVFDVHLRYGVEDRRYVVDEPAGPARRVPARRRRPASSTCARSACRPARRASPRASTSAPARDRPRRRRRCACAPRRRLGRRRRARATWSRAGTSRSGASPRPAPACSCSTPHVGVGTVQIRAVR